MKPNHQADYKYNYEVLKREYTYAKQELLTLLPEIENKLQAGVIKRLAADLEKAIKETQNNLKQPKFITP